MKKTASKKSPIADTKTRLEETQSETQEKVAALAAMRISYAKTIDTQAESVTRYLDHAASDGMKRTKHILPTVADIKAHPLPAWQDLTATPVSKRTLAEVTDEITDYLGDEYRYFAPGMMHGLEDFLTWYQGTFLEAMRRLTEKKVATAETLGKTNAKKKLVEAFAALPSFPTPEAFEDYCQRILKRDATDPTDEIVRQWREGKPSPFPSPEAFANAFRDALKKDAEATAEINGDGQTAAPCGFTEEDRDILIKGVDDAKKAKEYAKIAAGKHTKQRKNGFYQAEHIEAYNAEHVDEQQRDELKRFVSLDKEKYPDPSPTRPKGYWKEMLGLSRSYKTPDALRKAVMRKRNDKRGQYEREGKKRGPYKKRI